MQELLIWRRACGGSAGGGGGMCPVWGGAAHPLLCPRGGPRVSFDIPAIQGMHVGSIGREDAQVERSGKGGVA